MQMQTEMQMQVTACSHMCVRAPHTHARTHVRPSARTCARLHARTMQVMYTCAGAYRWQSAQSSVYQLIYLARRSQRR